MLLLCDTVLCAEMSNEKCCVYWGMLLHSGPEDVRNDLYPYWMSTSEAVATAVTCTLL